MKNELEYFMTKINIVLLDSSKSWTEKEIVNEIEINPEKFSLMLF